NQDTDTDGLINALDTDSDGDGLSDGVEDANADGLIAGDTSNDRVLDAGETWTETDPINADTDSDGLPDGWEIAHNLDPFANDASLDPDTDGLDNAAEFANQTDPHVGDTDTDGLPDGWEVAHNLDPLTNDADLDPDTDGLDNAAEFANQTDPQAADTDSDGMSDRWEITRGFDPLDGISDLDGDTFSNLAEYQGGSDPRSAESLPVAHLSQVRRAAGNAGSIALGVAQFENGSTVLTGSFEGSLTLGGGARATAFTSRGGSDAWAACYAANGDLTWAVQAGGAGEDAGRDVHTFPDGSCVVVGGFSGTAEFHSPGMASVQLSAVGGRDVFVARYTPDGVLAWVRAAGGVDADTATGVVGLPDGRCVLTGEFTGQGAAFGVGGPNAATLASAGGTDIYLAWYDAEGTFLQAVRAGSSTDDLGSGIALGMDGTLLVVGQITGPTEFASAGDRSILDGEPAGDVFLAKYTADGTFVWARQAGGPGSDTALGIAALADGGILMTGTFSDTATFGPGDSNETDLTTFGQTDAFLARYDATGALVWARGVGGPGVDVGAAVAALPDGTALFTGDFEKDAAFGDGGAAILLSSEGDRDVFLARCDADGNVLSARRVGGPEHNQGSDIAVFLGGRVAVCGSFTGLALFGAGEPGAVALDSPGHESAFLARYGYLVYGIRTMAPAGGDMGVSIAAGLSMTADHAPTALEEIEVVHEKLDPYGPRYTFLMGRCQINVAEYVRFLNDLLATQDTMVPSAYVDPATGNLYFNERMTSESLLFEPDEANENGYFNYGIQYQAAGRDTAALYTYTPAWKDHPIVGVTWCGAVKYCNWLSRRKGLSPDRWCYSEGPELADWHPTHLAKGQWEDGFDEAERASWIARHPDGFRLPMDDYAAGSSAYNEFLKAVSWDGRVSRHRPQGTAFHLNYWEKQEEYHGPMAGEAGSPNYYGLKHALGNVWEWMNDGGESGDLSRRAIRGWGWRNSFENVQDMEGPRFRLGAVPSNASSAVGFRVVSVRDVQFRVQLSTSPDFAVRDLQERTLGESRTWHPELAPAQTYYWRVSAQYPTEGEPPPTTWFGADGGQDDPGWSSFATVSDMVVVDIPVQAAWNLISVPIESVSVRDLMDPGPGPLVFWTWDRLNAAYVQTDTIAPHSGYWFYAKTAGALRVKGMEVPDDEIPTRVGTGWNLIGVVNDILELDLEGISGVFRWDAVDRHHLVESEQLLRFIGYWIQVAPDTPEFILHEKAPRVGH
ncbi:MAG: SUMF1/EgtB/PvdO family nonheme iron enzyme, partial [Lentisphaeria bacterium]|nr:SUMF1/EgtB/PvdO family nonheme iron enzyme [Lentisphaeria bacterium]